MACVTTSKKPSIHMRRIAKSLGGQKGNFYLPRGNRNIDTVLKHAAKKGMEALYIVERKGRTEKKGESEEEINLICLDIISRERIAPDEKIMNIFGELKKEEFKGNK